MANRKPRRRAKAPPTTTEARNYLSGASFIAYSMRDIAIKLIDSAICIEDDDKARDHVAQIMRTSFLSRYGGAMARTERRHTHCEHELAKAKERLATVRDQQAATAEDVEKQTAADSSARSDTAIASWQMRHKVEGFIIALMLVGAIAASYITALANLIGTGMPVFLETPVAYFMAGMAPLAGLAIKLFGGVFRTDRGYRRYTIALNSAAIALVLTWTLLFALLYHGFSTEALGTGLFDEPSLWDKSKDTLFVAATILTEIALGALLAARLDRIVRIYSPDFTHPNPKSLVLAERVKHAEKLAEQHTEKLSRLAEQLTGYQSSLDLQTGMALLALESRRARLSNSDFI